MMYLYRSKIALLLVEASNNRRRNNGDDGGGDGRQAGLVDAGENNRRQLSPLSPFRRAKADHKTCIYATVVAHLRITTAQTLAGCC